MQAAGHHRAVTSIGMNAKFNPTGQGLVGAYKQPMTQVRVANQSQP